MPHKAQQDISQVQADETGIEVVSAEIIDDAEEVLPADIAETALSVHPLVMQIMEAKRGVDCQKEESGGLMLQADSAEARSKELQGRADSHHLDILEKEVLWKQNEDLLQRNREAYAVAQQEYKEALSLLESIEMLIVAKEAVISKIQEDLQTNEGLRDPLIKSLHESRLEYERFAGLAEAEQVNYLEVMTDIKKRSVMAKLAFIEAQKEALSSGADEVVNQMLRGFSGFPMLEFQKTIVNI